MRRALTKRRACGAALLLLGAIVLGIGVGRGSASILILGLAIWLGALLGAAVLLIQRLNAVKQLVASNHGGVERFLRDGEAIRSLLKQSCKEGTALSRNFSTFDRAQSQKWERQLKETAGLVARLEAVSAQLTAAQSESAKWREAHASQLANLHSQFGEFVAYLGEWAVLAESQAKENFASLSEAQDLSRKENLNALLRKLESIGETLGNVQHVTNGVAGAFEVQEERIAAAIARTAELVAEEVQSGESQAVNAAREQSKHLSAALDMVLTETRRTVKAVDSDRKQLETVSKRLDGALSRQRTELARIKVAYVKEIEALLQLRSVLAPRNPMPLLGGWSMDPVSMLAVVKEIMTRQPDLVFECGSGTSTLWIAKTLKRVGQGRLISLEHNEAYHASTMRALRDEGLDGIVDLHLTPLRAQRVGQGTFEWYDVSKLELPERLIDFLLIDGPPGTIGTFARYPALPVLEPLLADEAVVVLDDADRPEEIDEALRWLEEFPGLQPLVELGDRTKAFTFTRPEASRDMVSVAHLQAS